jgi:hypothetical protein
MNPRSITCITIPQPQPKKKAYRAHGKCYAVIDLSTTVSAHTFEDDCFWYWIDLALKACLPFGSFATR